MGGKGCGFMEGVRNCIMMDRISFVGAGVIMGTKWESMLCILYLLSTQDGSIKPTGFPLQLRTILPSNIRLFILQQSPKYLTACALWDLIHENQSTI